MTTREVRTGGQVHYCGKNQALARICGRKTLEVLHIETRADGQFAEIKHRDWLVTQVVPVGDLQPV